MNGTQQEIHRWKRTKAEHIDNCKSIGCEYYCTKEEVCEDCGAVKTYENGITTVRPRL